LQRLPDSTGPAGAVTLIVAESSATENADVPPLTEVSTAVPGVPDVWSHAR
jgi:hypothetical protein